ncbi:MAG TPA: ABC transporter substrate-binding protein, partial [Candidatus Bathyarchaeia archaeon]|nr:ABC transporter substrate-binding protein [Candidatus Bathyarchaeia archaeon]
MDKRLTAIFVIIVVLVALVGGTYYYTTISSKTTTTQSLPTSIVVEESEQPDSLDPAASFSTPGWEVIEQVYQGLIAPEGSSLTNYIGVLARSWDVSSNGMNYTFYLRQNVTFSNGDSFTAYDVWFSLYRT